LGALFFFQPFCDSRAPDDGERGISRDDWAIVIPAEISWPDAWRKRELARPRLRHGRLVPAWLTAIPLRRVELFWAGSARTLLVAGRWRLRFFVVWSSARRTASHSRGA
jgi:hypothetical protein